MAEKNDYTKDINFKRIIKNKSLISYILKHFVEEYKDMEREEIESLISLKGVIHKKTKEVVMLESEISDEKSGVVRLDSVLGAYLPNKEEQIGIFIDIEMQRKGESIKKLYGRAEYYLSSLMVKQKKIIFEHDAYEDMIKVSGIWLCVHNGSHGQNIYETKETQKTGKIRVDKSVYDKRNIQFIYIGDKGDDEHIEPLRILFFEEGEEKLRLLKEKYNIDLEEEEVREMCDFREFYKEYYEERGMTIGMEKGMEQGMKKGMEKGMEQKLVENIQTLMETLNKTYEEVTNYLRLDKEEKEKYQIYFQ